MSDEMLIQDLREGEIVKIGGFPFRYVGDGKVSSAMPIDEAREHRDSPIRTGLAQTRSFSTAP